MASVPVDAGRLAMAAQMRGRLWPWLPECRVGQGGRDDCSRRIAELQVLSVVPGESSEEQEEDQELMEANKSR